MTQTVLTPLLGKEFDRFLFASVGEERNGMALSVISALARLGVDPWDETVALSSLPKDKAKERLAALIASTTKNLATNLSADTVAARLIALLPAAANPDIPTTIVAVRNTAARPAGLFIVVVIAAIVSIGLLVVVSDRSRLFGFRPPAATEMFPSR